MRKYGIVVLLLICMAYFSCVENNQGMAILPPTIVKTKEEWSALLSPNAYEVMVMKKTEAKFKNKYNKETRSGTYYSAATGEVLFSSEDKFESNTGWPAFSRPVNPNSLSIKEDRSNGMLRYEVIETSTGLHLGHIFEDGPIELGGRRFCINSAALIFKPENN